MVPRVSSIAPNPTMSVHATSAASGSGLAPFTSWKKGTTRESPSAARNPRYIARPPMVGVGFGCTRRSEGWSITPAAITNLRTRGVATNVTAAATPKTSAYACRPAVRKTARYESTTRAVCAPRRPGGNPRYG